MYAQDKYDKAMASLDDKEKRVVMAETMLEATLQYESRQSKASSEPNSTKKTSMLSFDLGWRKLNDTGNNVPGDNNGHQQQ
ncbi:GTPase-activating protein gyp3-like [Salvia divinorum]|uniref:GTPase-activating protein gyp3-like n=1 Tax=Salvia divinorum TaxID=28513 RepID=A0ABD1GAT5_SALDI